MNLQSQAENEVARRTRSKLETQREAILELRRKHWTHRQIADWLNERGVKITLSAVHRFCQRSIARRSRHHNPLEIEQEKTNFIPALHPPNQPTNEIQKTTHRFNLDI